MKKIYRLLLCVIVFLYFLVGILTLSHYGVNWDEVNHLTRGQAYIYFFLTGREHYEPTLFTDLRHSLYQIKGYDFTYQKAKDGDHPVFSDNMSAFFNYIFFQKLGWFSDMDSSHLYGIFVVSGFLLFLYVWVETLYNPFTAIISVIALILYPAFYGESHFNVQKDIPEAVFYGLTIMSFYRGYIRKSARWIIVSSFFFGFALGTKFNIFFMPLTVVFWQILSEGIFFFRYFLSTSKEVRFSFILYPIIAFGIFYFSWPHLWYDPINNILQVFMYYKNSGLHSVPSMPDSYYFYGFNTYAIRWIWYTTPFITLFFSIIGIFTVIFEGWREKNKPSYLIFLWFVIPIIRVSIPSAIIYGGIRHIMEYIPAIAILTGIGANKFVCWLFKYLINWFKIQKYMQNGTVVILQGIVILSFIPITIKIISLHPNESVYFNPIIGGLKGAKEIDIPGWGNSLGNTYRQGIDWINIHAEKKAQVALLFELLSNVPNVLLRGDIEYSNTLRSGPNRKGEYIMGVTNYDSYDQSYHRKYLERFLVPVYKVTVDGVDLLKIWKNDEFHLKNINLKEKILENLPYMKSKSELLIVFPSVSNLLRTEILYSSRNCKLPLEGYYRITNGVKRIKIPGTILNLPDFHWYDENPEEGKLSYIFAGDELTKLSIMNNGMDSCLLQNPIIVNAWVLEQNINASY